MEQKDVIDVNNNCFQNLNNKNKSCYIQLNRSKEKKTSGSKWIKLLKNQKKM